MAQPAHTLSDVIRTRPVRAAARQASYGQSGREYRVLAIRSGNAAWDPAAAAWRASRAARSAELFMGRVSHALRHAALLRPAGHAYEAANEVAGDTALAGARGLALEIASNAPLSLAGSKLLLDALATDTVEARQAEILAIIEGAMNSTDYREGARAFLEKRKPIFTGR